MERHIWAKGRGGPGASPLLKSHVSVPDSLALYPAYPPHPAFLPRGFWGRYPRRRRLERRAEDRGCVCRRRQPDELCTVPSPSALPPPPPRPPAYCAKAPGWPLACSPCTTLETLPLDRHCARGSAIWASPRPLSRESRRSVRGPYQGPDPAQRRSGGGGRELRAGSHRLLISAGDDNICLKRDLHFCSSI